MQKVKNQNRIWGWILALVITSSLAVACNNEGEKTTETTTDTPAAAAPTVDTTKKDSLPPIDTTGTTRPDGSH